MRSTEERGCKGSSTGTGAHGAVYMDDNKVGGHVISGPGCRMEIESIMRGRNARRYAYERAVRLMMTGGMVEEGNDEEEGEEESARDKWIEERVTMERFEASLYPRQKLRKEQAWTDGMTTC